MEWLVDYKGSTEPDQSEILPNSGGLPRSLIANILQICCDSTGFYEGTNEDFAPVSEPQNEEEMGRLEKRRALPGAEPFRHTLPVLRSDQAPLKFSQVSRSWRQIALETPSLWRRFQLFMEVGTDESAILGLKRLCQEARIWLARSGNCPLTYSLSITHSLEFLQFKESNETFSLYESLFEILSAHASRWRNVNFTSCFNGRSHEKYPYDTLAGTSRSAKTFWVEVGDSVLPESPFTFFIVPEETQTPELQVFQFSLRGFAIDDQLLVAQSLTFLNLESGNLTNILPFFESLPNLRWLHFTFQWLESDHKALPVEHENLQMLYLSYRRNDSDPDDASDLANVLNFLTLPSLREVILTDFIPATDPVLSSLARMIQRSARRTRGTPTVGLAKPAVRRRYHLSRPIEWAERSLIKTLSSAPYYTESETLSYDYRHTYKVILASLQAHPPPPPASNNNSNTTNTIEKHGSEDLPRMVTFIHYQADFPDTCYQPTIVMRSEEWSGVVDIGRWSSVTFTQDDSPGTNSFFVKHYEGELDISRSFAEYRIENEDENETEDEDEEEDAMMLDGYDYYSDEEDGYDSYDEAIAAEYFPCCDDDWD